MGQTHVTWVALAGALLLGAACVTVGDGDGDGDGDGSGNGSPSLFDGTSGNPAGDSSGCDDVCNKIDGCGILAQANISVGECTSTCVAKATAEEIQFALGASCGELAEALEDFDTGGAQGGSSEGGGSCAATGSSCSEQTDCCNYLDAAGVCADFVCSDYCQSNSDCASGCCAPLNVGGSVCSPPSYCN